MSKELTAEDFDNQLQQAQSALDIALLRGDESKIAFWEKVIAGARKDIERCRRRLIIGAPLGARSC